MRIGRYTLKHFQYLPSLYQRATIVGNVITLFEHQYELVPVHIEQTSHAHTHASSFIKTMNPKCNHAWRMTKGQGLLPCIVGDLFW